MADRFKEQVELSYNPTNRSDSSRVPYLDAMLRKRFETVHQNPDYKIHGLELRVRDMTFFGDAVISAVNDLCK